MNTIAFAPPLPGRGRNSAAGSPRAWTAGTSELPHDISERLRAARMQAVARRKLGSSCRLPPAVSCRRRGRAAWRRRRLGLWNRIASVLPLIALAAGPDHHHRRPERATAPAKLAEVDAALLTDDLPPAAYADPGFRRSS